MPVGTGLQQAAIIRPGKLPAHGTDDALTHSLRHFGNHCISKLSVGLRVRDYYFLVIWEAHQAGAFSWRKPPWRLLALLNKYLRTILIVTGAQSSAHAFGVCDSEAEAVAL